MRSIPSDAGIESLLDHLATHYQVNVRDYQPALIGRLRRRMDQIHIEGFFSYKRFLLGHAEEYGVLSRRLFLNHTTFFRDTKVWDAVLWRVLPGVLLQKADDAPIRMWCAGCSSGEEVYTLAMLALEVIGAERFERKVRIFATDIDPKNLDLAREGLYQADRLDLMEPLLRDRYFTSASGSYRFNRDMRKSVLFSSHDMLKDPPFLGIDVLLCRNTLMYFNAAARSRVLTGFHRVLGDSGYLIIGTAEVAPDRRLFTADHRRLGIYLTSPPPPRALPGCRSSVC